MLWLTVKGLSRSGSLALSSSLVSGMLNIWLLLVVVAVALHQEAMLQPVVVVLAVYELTSAGLR
jgi:predicted YcjX-like family ATPase